MTDRQAAPAMPVDTLTIVLRQALAADAERDREEHERREEAHHRRAAATQARAHRRLLGWLRARWGRV